MRSTPTAEDFNEPSSGKEDNQDVAVTELNQSSQSRNLLRHSDVDVADRKGRVPILNQSTPIGRITRIVFPSVLLYVLIGTFLDREWWDTFFFEGGILDSSHWRLGWDWLRENLLLPTIIVSVVLTLLFWFVGRKGRHHLGSIWRVLTASMYARRGFYVQLILILLVCLRLAYGHAKIQDEQKSLQTYLQTHSKLSPLTRPTSFIFLSKDNIDSLHGQYEPDLTRSGVIEEMKNSTDIRAGVNVEEFVKTEVGKNEFQRRLTEYHQNPKNTERKLGDLLKFLIENDFVTRFENPETKSSEIKQLDDTTELLKSQYNLFVDPKQLTAVRDKLLGQEIERLIGKLKELHGLVLVQGDWSVEIQPDAYLLKRLFLERVTDSPLCEAKIPKNDISSQNKEIIESLKGERMRLSVFGNVITGMAGNSRTVRVNPMAVF